MSHSTVLVLLPARPVNIEEAVTKALAPFDENTDVPAYKTRCCCVGNTARRAAHAYATATVGTAGSFRASFDHTAPDADARWKTHIAPFSDLADATERAHPLYERPDADCDDCHGTALRESTRNPLSKWDWYQIGGRWDGAIPDNACDVANLPADFVSFAVLDPSGEWHEQGSMGWFGVVSDERDDWDTTFRTLMSRFPDAFAVCVDVHI